MVNELINPAAFARSAYDGKGEPGSPFPHHEQDGMTLRDYFAAHAPFTCKDAEFALAQAGKVEVSHSVIYLWLAQMRYSYADAMLKARAIG